MAKVKFETARNHVLRHGDNLNRLEHVFTFRERMKYSDWLRLLGENWTCSDNISEWEWSYTKRWKQRAARSPLSIAS